MSGEPIAPAGARRWVPCEEDASGHSFVPEEAALLAEVLASGRLLAASDGFVGQLEAEFTHRYGVPEAVACSSGTSAVHATLVALGLSAGAEVITTPMTDIGGGTGSA
ncbi:DegT/DnrJ/EryC1/StrS family aminotransferase [Streptomyces bobili]|uniref:DegT/DnrJ/EryC1/StrS family aminotransferase n=1 Tax=Streptomyces bobili TaxID=67280 RepID=UPI003442EC3D